MPKANCTFRKRDVTAAIQAAVKAGLEIGRVEIGSDGRIIIVPGKPAELDNSESNEWDRI